MSRCSPDAIAVIARLKEAQAKRQAYLRELRARIERDLGYRVGSDGTLRPFPGGPTGSLEMRRKAMPILNKLHKVEAKVAESAALVKQLEASCQRPRTPRK